VRLSIQVVLAFIRLAPLAASLAVTTCRRSWWTPPRCRREKRFPPARSRRKCHWTRRSRLIFVNSREKRASRSAPVGAYTKLLTGSDEICFSVS
jgi:hypothetical protein